MNLSPKPIWTVFAASLIVLVGLFGPLSSEASAFSVTLLIFGFFSLACAVIGRFWLAVALVPIGLLGAFMTALSLMQANGEGAWGFWSLLWGFLFISIFAVGRVSTDEATSLTRTRFKAFLPSASVPFLLLLIWQGLVVGYGVPKGIFPSVVDVWRSLTASFNVLLSDAYVTFIKEVLLGSIVGLAMGFLAGVGIAFSTFLRRGFLPLAAAFGAVPIVGLAPVLGRAFGVDWESKAAVVVIVTFFPIVLNTVQGLVSVDVLKLELLRAYAATPREVFFKLRLPNALPYLFNALKLAAVLAVISVIVAEFLIPGPPEGLGQRISLSARRGAYDVVFAAILVSSVISISIYGALAWLEKRLTGWHPSFREGGS